jgi:SpoVK/Ycf46/Vps4 family AAA+-type ATPase
MNLQTSESVIFDTSLIVFKSNDSMTIPQKCKIRQKYNFPANNVVIVKCDENRIFICKLFYLNENFDDKQLMYIDESVEINPKVDNRAEIRFAKEILLISEEIQHFKELSIDVELDLEQLNFDIIKDKESLKRILISTLKHYTFTENCLISCKHYGVSNIFVKSTDCRGIGRTSEETIILINKISMKNHNDCQIKPLGGVENVKDSLEKLISLNLDFLKTPNKFTFKPGNQALIIGPVGTGKTNLIYNVAKKHSCVTFEIGGDIFKPYPGETEEEIQKIFEKVKLVSKIVGKQLILILIENIEVFCPRFNANMKDISHSSRISSLIFSLLDEIAQSKLPLIVIGTTSKLESLNDMVRRSTRLGNCEIILDMPNEIQRREIIQKIFENLSKEIPSHLVNFLAESTPGFVGADLESLCVTALRENSDLSIGFKHALKTVTPSVMRENLGLVTKSNMTLDDIGCMEDLKKTLRTSVLGPLRNPERFHKFGLKPTNGILLYGPSGCAKTTIVKCLAGEAKMTLISVSSAEIYSPYVGEAEKFIVKLFNQARMNAPTILFFDEIDTIVGNRNVSGGTNDSHMRILSTLLTEIDGFGSGDKKTVLIIGATNKPQMIDDALMRPGRFDKLIHVPAPNNQSRINILKHLVVNLPISKDVDILDIAQRTENFSGADLLNLCNEAAMCAATKDFDADKISKCDFEDVLTYLRPSLTSKQIEFYQKFENKS